MNANTKQIRALVKSHMKEDYLNGSTTVKTINNPDRRLVRFWISFYRYERHTGITQKQFAETFKLLLFANGYTNRFTFNGYELIIECSAGELPVSALSARYKTRLKNVKFTNDYVD
jgi:hypothetical protein